MVDEKFDRDLEERKRILIEEFIFLRKVLHEVEKTKNDAEKYATVLRHFKSGLLGSAERTERKEARSEKELEKDFAELDSKTKDRVRDHFTEMQTLHNKLVGLVSRGGEIEQDLRACAENSSKENVDKAVASIKEAIRDDKGSMVVAHSIRVYMEKLREFRQEFVLHFREMKSKIMGAVKLELERDAYKYQDRYYFRDFERSLLHIVGFVSRFVPLKKYQWAPIVSDVMEGFQATYTKDLPEMKAYMKEFKTGRKGVKGLMELHPSYFEFSSEERPRRSDLSPYAHAARVPIGRWNAFVKEVQELVYIDVVAHGAHL